MTHRQHGSAHAVRVPAHYLKPQAGAVGAALQIDALVTQCAPDVVYVRGALDRVVHCDIHTFRFQPPTARRPPLARAAQHRHRPPGSSLIEQHQFALRKVRDQQVHRSAKLADVGRVTGILLRRRFVRDQPFTFADQSLE